MQMIILKMAKKGTMSLNQFCGGGGGIHTNMGVNIMNLDRNEFNMATHTNNM